MKESPPEDVEAVLGTLGRFEPTIDFLAKMTRSTRAWTLVLPSPNKTALHISGPLVLNPGIIPGVLACPTCPPVI